MKVLVIGGGGREHALCWKLRQSPELTELFCAPGNPGIEEIADLVPIAPEDTYRLADFATEFGIDLTVVGPELPLTLGIVDEFANRELAIFGPKAQAAELEGSKVFAKEFMKRHEIPTADFVVTHDAAETRRAVDRLGLPAVLKADGLALGKGVLIAGDKKELDAAIDVFFEQRKFGAGGDRLVVEEFLEGDEVSAMALCDGHRILPLASSKDYKRAGDGDTGANTGGMGSHSPAGIISAEQNAEILERVMLPVVNGMAEENRIFAGVIYAGVMLGPDGIRVLEFNVRMGDPEVQTLLMRMEDDLLPVLRGGAEGRFPVSRLHFRHEAAACLVLAGEGYPESSGPPQRIEGLAAAAERPGVEVFHAGTARTEGHLTTSGGRVLNVCATGADLREALKLAYTAAGDIFWPGQKLRRDIGRTVLERVSDGE